MNAIHSLNLVARVLRLLAGMAAALPVVLAAQQAGAQVWPARNVTIIVPLAAGTGMDTLVRLYSERLSQALGKPVLIDNRPGAALMLGVTALSKAAPDGYTLGVATAPAMAINPTLYKQVAYDVDKDFVPISLYVKSPFILVINPTLGPRNVQELIKYTKDNTGKLSYSTPGSGAAQHLAVEFMKQKFGLDITHVPYKSTGAAHRGGSAGPGVRQRRRARGAVPARIARAAAHFRPLRPATRLRADCQVDAGAGSRRKRFARVPGWQP